MPVDTTRAKSLFLAASDLADPAERAAWLTFVIVGAGATGVELAGALGEIARDYVKQAQAAAGSKDPNVSDLLLITGVDSSSLVVEGAARPRQQEEEEEGGQWPSPETRQGLACLVLREKGGGGVVGKDGGFLSPQVREGVLTVGRDQLRRWLADGAPP